MNDRISEVVARLHSPEHQHKLAEWSRQIGTVDAARLAAYRESRMCRDEGYKKMLNWRNRMQSCLFKKWFREGAVARIGAQEKTMMKLCGCTRSELVTHLESLFELGMTWQNHGRKGWHLDHKRPVYMFDLQSEAGFAQANHWTNLQPLWWWEHREKSKMESKLANLGKQPVRTLNEDMLACGFSESELRSVGLWEG